MFASLKNKIKEETGSDIAVASVPNQRHNTRIRSRLSSTISVNSNSDDAGGNDQVHHMSEQLHNLHSQCNELTTKVNDLNMRLQTLQEEKSNVEKTNEILLETVKVAQTQKDIYCEEQEKIQNFQQTEIEKLKSLLSFRDQEAVDRLTSMRQNKEQIEHLTAELERLKHVEPMVEELQDELERLRHAAQLDKNSLTTTLAAVEEENRNMKIRLRIVEHARLETLATMNVDEKINALVHERKLLEQHLEEAHLQLSDIKSSWSGQNLALETQVSRLSKQVAEETTEKRKALRARDDVVEKVKQLEFEMMNLKDEMKQRDDKIKLLEEEIDELSLTLRQNREENEQQLLFERNKVETLQTETDNLKAALNVADERFSEYAANAERVASSLLQENAQLKEQLNLIQTELEHEKEEKLTALLRNAEISQSEEILKKELRIERDETNELHEKNEKLETELATKLQEIGECKMALEKSEVLLLKNSENAKEYEEMKREINEKNKTIKTLNQRLADLKKTLQKEFRNSQSFDAVAYAERPMENCNSAQDAAATAKSNEGCKSVDDAAISGAAVVMDEVNFKYLKHVVVKFLTSREVEARHLIRAVATLLKLSNEEEKLLHDTLNWKMSWFGTKPDHGSGQRACSIPPS